MSRVADDLVLAARGADLLEVASSSRRSERTLGMDPLGSRLRRADGTQRPLT